MKRVLSILFLLGVMNFSQSLFGDVVYHLSILVDPNLGDSIALVNLFPGNSTIRVTNPSSGRSQVFTVQQRNTIGRKIALPPSAAASLGLGEGSIAETRIVELALNNGESRPQVNPAAEYREIISAPVSQEIFSVPATDVHASQSTVEPPDSLRPTTSGGDYRSSDYRGSEIPISSSTIPQDGAPVVNSRDSGLPPITPSPTVSNKNPNSNGNVPVSQRAPDKEALLIKTSDENLRIPLPAKPKNLAPSKPSTNYTGGKVNPDINTSLPSGDPLSRRNRVADTRETPSRPLLNPGRSEEGRVAPDLTTSLPPGDPRASRSNSAADTKGKSSKPLLNPERSEGKKVGPDLTTSLPPGDLRASRSNSSADVKKKSSESLLTPSNGSGEKKVDPALTTRIPLGDPRASRSNSVSDTKEEPSKPLLNPERSEGKKVDPTLTTRLPRGDPRASRSNRETKEEPSKPLLNPERSEGKKVDPTLTTRLPPGDPRASRSNSTADTEKKPSQPLLSPDRSKEKEVDAIITTRLPPGDPRASRSGDTRTEGAKPSFNTTRLTESTSETGKSIQRPRAEYAPDISRSAPELRSLPRGAEIYFPTTGEMSPPPGSTQEERPTPQSNIVSRPSHEPNRPLVPEGRTVLPSGENRLVQNSRPRVPPNNSRNSRTNVRVIGTLNRLDLPSGYYIQLAAFRDVRKTQPIYERFVNEYKMNIIPAKVNGKKFYRCLIGNLRESDVAEILRRVRSAGYTDAFVYRNTDRR